MIEYVEYLKDGGGEMMKCIKVDCPSCGVTIKVPERAIESHRVDDAMRCARLAMEKCDEARRLFDEAMEYADSAVTEVHGLSYPVSYTKPRPVAPWKGE